MISFVLLQYGVSHLTSFSRCVFRDLFKSNTGPIVKESMAKGEARYEITQIQPTEIFALFYSPVPMK